MPPDESAAALVRRARTAAGISQRELARRSGVHLNTISRIELQERDPQWSVVVRLIRACGLDLIVELDGWQDL